MITNEKEKIYDLDGDKKFQALTEITRIASMNQLDLIIANKSVKNSIFATSYFYMISDHKAVTIRINKQESQIMSEIKQKSKLP